MKDSSRRSRQTISLLPRINKERNNTSSTSLLHFFRGWLQEVKPDQSEAPDTNLAMRLLPPVAPSGTFLADEVAKPFTPHSRRLTLSTNEVLGVNRATIREGNTHRIWPPDVLLKFMTAEVITRTPRTRG